MSAFGEYLQRHGKAAAYKRLMTKQGITANTSERWERGTSQPAPWLAAAIATALGVHRDELFPPERPAVNNEQPIYHVGRYKPHGRLRVTRIDRENQC